MKIAIAGLVHGHVDGFLRALKGRTDVQLVGLQDAHTPLHAAKAKRHGLDLSLFYTDLATMLEKTRPDAVAAFTSTYDHPAVVNAAAKRRIHVMMEKPLAVSMKHARAIESAARQSGIHVIVNYETTWYPSHGAIRKLFKDTRDMGPIRKIVAMDGHQGPKEIGVGPEFLGWLTDPAQNGAGALFDFGCYGANLMTWLLDDERPLSVRALTQRFKPDVYPNVDDEATILVEYKGAQGIIQGSWNWPYNRKDLEVYGAAGYAIATGGTSLRVRAPGQKENTPELAPLPADERDSISYLAAIVRGRVRPSGLSSLENNMIVTEILEAARESARTGRAIRLRK